MIEWLKRTENQTTKILEQLKAAREPVMLFGAGLCGAQYLHVLRTNGIEVSCFLDDDKEKQAQGVCGLPVMSTSHLSTRGGQIVISSYGPDKLERRLLSIDPDSAARIVKPDFYLWEDGLDYAAYYEEHEEEIAAADALLADEKSHKVFQNLLHYKISRDRALIEAVRDDARLQYFDPEVITFAKNEVFLDLGAYIGDTVEAFAKHVNGEYQKIVALEPDKANYEQLCKAAEKLHDVACYPYGIGATDGITRFASDGTWTSVVSDSGDTEITVKSVDSLFAHGRLTFLKADIEGLEKPMLQGAETTIREQMPQMAIAVYHCKEDIFQILHTIDSYHAGYRFYLRHYTEMPIDTVLYAVHGHGGN